MKKLLAILVVLAICVPAMADVAVTTDNSVCDQLTITLTASANEIVGVALLVDSASPVTAMAVDSFFDVFVDSAFTIGAGYNIGDGTGIATQGAPGELGFPQSSFAICIAGLDDDGIGAGTEEAPASCTIVLTIPGGSADVDIQADTLRGTVVSYQGAETVTGLPALDIVVCEDVAVDCVKSDAPFYADWLGSETNAAWQWNKPDCWCYEFNCRGDSDGIKGLGGLFRIDSVDLGALADAFNVGDKKLTQTLICADFDHIKGTGGLFRVDSDDLGILATWFNIGDKKLPACALDWEDLDGPDGPGVGDGDDDYNGWIVP